MIKNLKDIEVGKLYSTKTKNPEKFIVLEILSSKLSSGGVKIKFIDSDYELTLDAKVLRRGNFKSPYCRSVLGVGWLGVGNFKCSDHNGNPTIFYNRWKAILNRCYLYRGNNKSYNGCRVDEEWLCFQNFATWASNQKNFKTGWDIDKDLFCDGTRTYSPKTCCMLPYEINNALFKKIKKKTTLPVGVSLHPNGLSFLVRCNSNLYKHNYVGSYSDLNIAKNTYLNCKTMHLIKLVEKFKNELDLNTYQKLLDYISLNKD